MSDFVRTICSIIRGYCDEETQNDKIYNFVSEIDRLADHVKPIACKLFYLYLNNQICLANDVQLTQQQINSILNDSELIDYLDFQIERIRDDIEKIPEISMDPLSFALGKYVPKIDDPDELLTILESLCFNNEFENSPRKHLTDPDNIYLCNGRINVSISKQS